MTAKCHLLHSMAPVVLHPTRSTHRRLGIPEASDPFCASAPTLLPPLVAAFETVCSERHKATVCCRRTVAIGCHTLLPEILELVSRVELPSLLTTQELPVRSISSEAQSLSATCRDTVAAPQRQAVHATRIIAFAIRFLLFVTNVLTECILCVVFLGLCLKLEMKKIHQFRRSS